MGYAKLETAKLADVDDHYYYGASCRSCLRSRRLSLSKLRAHLGGTFPLVKVREKLKCELCGGREVVVTFLAPDQRTGSLVHLFEKDPRG